jgi:hypothetical protein
MSAFNRKNCLEERLYIDIILVPHVQVYLTMGEYRNKH